MKIKVFRNQHELENILAHFSLSWTILYGTEPHTSAFVKHKMAVRDKLTPHSKSDVCSAELICTSLRSQHVYSLTFYAPL